MAVLFFQYLAYPMTTMKFAQKHKKSAKVGLIFLAKYNMNLLKRAEDFRNLAQMVNFCPIWSHCG